MDDMEKKNNAEKPFSILWRFTICLLVFGASVLVLTIPEINNDLTGLSSPVPGQSVNKIIYSQCEFLTEDFERTLQEQEKVMRDCPLYYKKLDDLSAQMAKNIQMFFEEVRNRAHSEKKGKTYVQLQPETAAISFTVKNLSASDLDFFVKLDSDEISKKDFIQKVYDQILNEGILNEDIQRKLPPESKILIFDSHERNFNPEPVHKILTETTAGALAVDLLIPMYTAKEAEDRELFKKRMTQLFSHFFVTGNLRETPEKTIAEQKKRKSTIKPLKKSVHIGDVLIPKGHKLTQNDLQLLSDHQMNFQMQEKKKSSWGTKVKKTALCLVFLIFAILYLNTVHSDMFKDNQKILLLAGIAILSLIANRIAIGAYYNFAEISSLPPNLTYLALPLGLAPGLIAAVCGLRAAICAGLFISGISAVALNDSFNVIVTGLLVSGITSVAVKNTSDYKRFFWNFFLSCFAATIFTNAIFLIEEIATGEIIFLRNALLIALLSDLLTTVLALLCLFILEGMTNISTNMTFLYYTNRNHSLLRQLQLEAPGTYHHSERVASIAEKAAGLIGANPLQIQACALFHDIGKLSAPGMFTENTSDTGNPHKMFTPKESAAIIRKHVTYGLELAKQKKLKKALCDAIAQHHGTDFISYFYELAKKDAAVPPDENDFRYSGPLPNTKEAIILSIADFSEAVSRSMPQLNKQDLRKKIMDILRKKQENGQLNDAHITFHELNVIVDSIVDSLVSMNHVRIAYPSFDKDNTKK